jgi:hypothetical protein
MVVNFLKKMIIVKVMIAPPIIENTIAIIYYVLNEEEEAFGNYLQIELSNAYPDLHSTHIFACSHF